MKDNLRSEDEKCIPNDTSYKQRIKLWDWLVRTSCKATYKVKDLSEKLLSILRVMFKCNKIINNTCK